MRTFTIDAYVSCDGQSQHVADTLFKILAAIDRAEPAVFMPSMQAPLIINPGLFAYILDSAKYAENTKLDSRS